MLKKTVLISIFVLVLIIVDVSSNSVLGDIVGPGMGWNLNASRPLYLSLMVFILQCLYCIAILVGLYYTLRGVWKVRNGRCNIWTGREIFERVCVRKKTTTKKQQKKELQKKKKEKTAFYILPVVNIRVLNLVLAGLLWVYTPDNYVLILFNQKILGRYVSALPH